MEKVLKGYIANPESFARLSNGNQIIEAQVCLGFLGFDRYRYDHIDFYIALTGGGVRVTPLRGAIAQFLKNYP